MATGKQLGEFAILSVVMPAAMGLAIWGSVELLSLAGIIHTPIPTPMPTGSAINQTGRISSLEPKGKILLQHSPNGRAGAATVVDAFKMQDGLRVDGLKAGDNVSFTAARVDGVWTVTKIEKQ